MTREEKIAQKQKEIEGLELKSLRTLREAKLGDPEAHKRLLLLEEKIEQKRQDMRNA